MVIFTERTVRRRCSAMLYGSIMIPWMSNARTCIKTSLPMVHAYSQFSRYEMQSLCLATSDIHHVKSTAAVILSQFEETPDLVQ